MIPISAPSNSAPAGLANPAVGGSDLSIRTEPNEHLCSAPSCPAPSLPALLRASPLCSEPPRSAPAGLANPAVGGSDLSIRTEPNEHLCSAPSCPAPSLPALLRASPLCSEPPRSAPAGLANPAVGGSDLSIRTELKEGFGYDNPNELNGTPTDESPWPAVTTKGEGPNGQQTTFKSQVGLRHNSLEAVMPVSSSCL